MESLHINEHHYIQSFAKKVHTILKIIADSESSLYSRVLLSDVVGFDVIQVSQPKKQLERNIYKNIFFKIFVLISAFSSPGMFVMVDSSLHTMM